MFVLSSSASLEGTMGRSRSMRLTRASAILAEPTRISVATKGYLKNNLYVFTYDKHPYY